MIQLRDYQNKAIDELRNALRTHQSVCFQSPTGSGKTAITAFMFERASQNAACWFIVHRRELVYQASKTFRDFGIKHGIVASGQPAMPHHNMQICMVQTLARRYRKLKPPKFIVWDECHHAASKTWKAIHEAFPNAKHIGLTATPERLDRKPLKDIFQTMVCGPTVSWLIENGYLSDYKLFAPASVNMNGIKTHFGDYDHDAVEKLLEKSTIVGDSVEHYKSMAMGKRGIGFCHSVKQSQLTTDAFNAAGIPSVHIDGSMPSHERDSKVGAFRAGKVLMLFNCNIAEEGFDLPQAEVLLDDSPTKSLSRVLQRYGRVLRPAAEKTHAIIIDAVGNSMRHGLPDDPRTWSLEGKTKKKRNNDDEAELMKLNYRLCPKCFAANKMQATSCAECEAELPRAAREIEQVEGELKEIDKSKRRVITPEKLEVAKARTFEELEKIRIARNYKPGWTMHMMKFRENKYGNSTHAPV